MRHFANSFIKRVTISLVFLTILDFSVASNAQAQAVRSSSEIKTRKNLSTEGNAKDLLADQGQSNTPVPVTTEEKSSEEASAKESASQQETTKKPNRIYLSTDTYRRDYREEEASPGFKSNEFGNLFGLQAGYDHVEGNALYYGGDLRFSAGNTFYDGGNLFTGELITGSTSNQSFNAEARVGYTFKVGSENRLLLTPFLGYGYQQWGRDLGGIIENYTWGYIATGLRSEYKLSPKFDIGLNLKLLFQQNVNINIRFVGEGSNLDLKLGNRPHYEVELPLTYHLVDTPSHGFDFNLTPYYRSQDIDRSHFAADNLGLVLAEPSSITNVYGARIGFSPFVHLLTNVKDGTNARRNIEVMVTRRYKKS
jgi:hypothetical protein